jgi:preprotein translocase subunit SecA
MKTAVLPIPGIVLGAYPERFERRKDAPRRDVEESEIARHSGRHFQRLAARATSMIKEVTALDANELAVRLQRVRSGMLLRGFDHALVAEAFALISRTCSDTLGRQPYETQLMAAGIMLDGQLAEMATGEGKTIAAAVCAATAALAGVPVHLMTANDYLVTRDAESLSPLYHALGLTVGAVTQSMDQEARRQAYACDITYSTAKELAFDYLRDRVARGRQRDDLHLRAARLNPAHSNTTLLRGLCMTIVDEADSILIDEACVPLVLAERSADSGQLDYLKKAFAVASALTASDYRLDRSGMKAELTIRGREVLERRTATAGNAWRNRLHREEMVCLALAALHIYSRDRHYLVRDGKVEIIDETTGRPAAGRTWSRGLHQLIELKEGCEPSDQQVTAAQITFQRFFRRYHRVSGSSGTLADASGELREVYGLHVVRVPLRKPSRRRLSSTRLYPDRKSQVQAVAARALAVSSDGRPVLIGTDSVGDSENLSNELTAAGIDHAVLNARQDAAEAELIAAAGQAGRITVTTNIAGRGTDIPLAAGVADRGGLHVICCQHNVSRRIDRQLVGRCARQGDPGSAETLLAVDQALLARWMPAWLRRCIATAGMQRPRWLVQLLVRLPQWAESARRRDLRRALLAHDLHNDRGRAFGGPGE